MDENDMSRDDRIAGSILFMIATVGLICNLSVVVFLNFMPLLRNSFGSLTLSQATVDCIHQFLFVVYVAPAIYTQNRAMYAVSHHFGFAALSAYQICCYSHVCISFNRFVAVCTPMCYTKVFSKWLTRQIIIVCWILGITNMTYMLYFVDCTFSLPAHSWIFTFKDTEPCYIVKWYVDFTLNSISVVIVACLDLASVCRLQFMTETHVDIISVQRRNRQRNLVYQASLQGILFITELITYFIISGYARNKWQAFALTTIAWCSVNGMDGMIVLLCNRDIHRQLKRLIANRVMPLQGASLTHASAYARRASVTSASGIAMTQHP